MKFEKFDIDDQIKQNLLDLGFFRTTDIQFKAIGPILNGEDVLAIAQTGSGKTAAFAIPIVDCIHQQKTNKRSSMLSALVLVPTRELSQQIGEVFAKLSKNTRVKTFAIYGGVEQEQQLDQIEGGVDVLIATPGRMFQFIRNKHLDISTVSFLVLDEADRMLDLGFIGDIEAVKRMLRHHHHQTLFFSATINTKIKRLAYSQIRSNALRIQISPEQQVSKNITHGLVKVEMDDKRFLLGNFLKKLPESKIMVFVRTQVRAQRVLEQLEKFEIKSFCLHGGMDQLEREKNLEAFRNVPHGVLIATDVTARGIDLEGITHVINYDLPDNPENYVHRIGRTGRGFAKGEAISFCSSEEKEKLKEIEEFLGGPLLVLEVDENLLIEPFVLKENMSISEMVEKLEQTYSPKDKRKKKKSKK